MTKILEQLFVVLRCSILNDIKLELALFLQSLRYQNRDRRIQRRGIAARALEVTLLTGLRTGEVIAFMELCRIHAEPPVVVAPWRSSERVRHPSPANKAKWTEIDLERKTWVIPPERLKDRKTRTEPHRVPLSLRVIAILKALPRFRRVCLPGPQAKQTAQQHDHAEPTEGHELRRIRRTSLGRSQERTLGNTTRTPGDF